MSLDRQSWTLPLCSIAIITHCVVKVPVRQSHRKHYWYMFSLNFQHFATAYALYSYVRIIHVMLAVLGQRC